MNYREYSVLNIFVWVVFPFSVVVLMSFMFVTCGNTNSVQTENSTNGDSIKHEFRMVTIPETLMSPDERSAYLVEHYWKNFKFSDTLIIHKPEISEQAFVDYIVLFPYTSKEVVDASIRSTLEQSRNTPAMYTWFTKMYEQYLYDPNSPFRNEEYYATVVESIVNDPQTDEVQKIRPGFQLEEINRNRLGSLATNFTYTLANGKKEKLQSIKAEYTLLFFYNPECGDCKRTKQLLQESETLVKLVDKGRLKIIALYTDSDLTIWKSYQSQIPSVWINGYDGTKEFDIKNKLYAIRAIPSLYLLDKDKRVLLKDGTVEQVINGFNSEIFIQSIDGTKVLKEE